LYLLTRHCSYYWISLLIAFGLIAVAPSFAKEKFPVPPGASLIAVADSMEFQGIPLKIRKFEVEMPVEGVLNFYRNAWKGRVVEDDMPPWKIISTRDGDDFFTVQVQAGGRNMAWGYLGISDLPKRVESGWSVQTKSDFPMMSGSQVINNFAHHDIGRRGRTIFITNKFSITGNAEYYRNHYTGQGWTPVMDQSPDQGGSQAFLFKRGDQTVSMTINQGEEGVTNIIVNDVSHGLF
jgi:hypothetical protein